MITTTSTTFVGRQVWLAASLALLLCLSAPAQALQALEDAALSGVTGQSGITLTTSIGSTGITASRITQVVDSNGAATATNCNAPNTNTFCNTMSLSNVSITPFDATVNNNTVITTLAVDAGQTTTGHPSAGLQLNWNNVQLVLQNMGIAPDTTTTTKTIGTWDMTGSGSLTLAGDNGLFNMGASNTKGYVSLNVGNVIFNNDPNNINGTSTWSVGGANGNRNAIFYSQTSSTLGGYPELEFTNFGFLFDAPQAQIGVDSTKGLYISTPQAAFNLTFNLLFDPTGASHFQYTSTPAGMQTDIPSINYGWRGHINNATVTLATGGLPSTASASLLTPAGLTQGLHAAVSFDTYAADFVNVLGEPMDNVAVDFGSWKGVYNPDDPSNLITNPNHQPQFNMPYVGADIVNAGQGAGALCFGSMTATGTGGTGACSGANTYLFGSKGLNSLGVSLGQTGIPLQAIDLPPVGPAYASIVRNFAAHSFSNSVAIYDPQNPTYDPSTHLSQNYGWGLIFSIGNTNTNAYLYPDNPNGGDLSQGGILADVVLTSQGSGTDIAHRFYSGNDLMIADTTQNLAIGLMGADLLFAARQTTIDLQKPVGGVPGGLSLSTSTAARYQVRGLLGGGALQSYASGATLGLPNPEYLSYYDLNLEADKLQFVIESPTDPNTGGFFGQYMPSGVGGTGNICYSSVTNPCYKNQSYLGFHGYLHLANLYSSADATTKALSNQSGDAYAVKLNTADTTFGAQQTAGFGSFLSLAEPHLSALNVDFRIANVTGSLQIQNGRLDLISGAAVNNISGAGCGTTCIDTSAYSQPSTALAYNCGGPTSLGYALCNGNASSHKVPQLAISQNIKIGATAIDPFTSAAGDPLQIGHTYFGEQDLGSIIIPSGTMTTYFALKPMN